MHGAELQHHKGRLALPDPNLLEEGTPRTGEPDHQGNNYHHRGQQEKHETREDDVNDTLRNPINSMDHPTFPIGVVQNRRGPNHAEVHRLWVLWDRLCHQ
jgi:hypothetical protein